ncbi:MAG: SH3 domain-containing protein [Chroococcales cyanobacterium]
MITPSQDNCKITSAIVSDPNPPANVRSSPEVAPNNLLGTLSNGTYLTVTEEQNGWFKINNPVEGWIAKSITESSCSQVTERINFPPNGTSARVKGQIIGGGSHEYLLKASAGQTLNITVSEGPFPFVFIPNDPNRQTELAQSDVYTGLREWSYEPLPRTGDYYLVLDSNFRGFTYDFLVEVK